MEEWIERVEEWCSSHDEPVEPPLSDLQELDFQDQFLSWIQPEVEEEAHRHPEEGANEAGTGGVGVEVEDGWYPSFPISVYLANQVETSRPFVPQPEFFDTALDVQADKTSSRSPVEDQGTVTRHAEEIQPALSPPPR